jgi:hypothetical protein
MFAWTGFEYSSCCPVVGISNLCYFEISFELRATGVATHMKKNPAWAYSNGMLTGVTYQFAIGRWTEKIEAGIATNEEAFDLIVPFLLEFCSGWTPLHRFGVYEMPTQERRALAIALKRAAFDSKGTKFESELFETLAVWLEKHNKPDLIVSVLGI